MAPCARVINNARKWLRNPASENDFCKFAHRGAGRKKCMGGKKNNFHFIFRHFNFLAGRDEEQAVKLIRFKRFFNLAPPESVINLNCAKWSSAAINLSALLAAILGENALLKCEGKNFQICPRDGAQ